VINAGDAIPAPWVAAPVVTVDEAALRDPAKVVERLHQAWAEREAVVVELGVDPVRFRTPEVIGVEPWRLSPETEPFGDRLHFPEAFVGRGDMSRGGLLLRSVRSATELTYIQLSGATRRGARPARLEPIR